VPEGRTVAFIPHKGAHLSHSQCDTVCSRRLPSDNGHGTWTALARFTVTPFFLPQCIIKGDLENGAEKKVAELNRLLEEEKQTSRRTIARLQRDLARLKSERSHNHAVAVRAFMFLSSPPSPAGASGVCLVPSFRAGREAVVVSGNFPKLVLNFHGVILWLNARGLNHPGICCPWNCSVRESSVSNQVRSGWLNHAVCLFFSSPFRPKHWQHSDAGARFCCTRLLQLVRSR
ncbi:hypothetical protein BaRGS_00001406, partial [Batillaria attramentaria]